MKATLDIPDDLYRLVKARSALEGRPIRSVAIQLFQDWLASHSQTPNEPSPDEPLTEADYINSPWLKIARNHIKPEMSHSMGEIREAIARGSAAEYAIKLATNQP